MRVILTGHKGFIGSNMLKALEERHIETLTFEWGDEFPDPKYDDWVIHMGAISSTTETNVEKIMKRNVDYTHQLLKLCASRGAHFQFSSSASVYGLKRDFTEDAPVDPRTPYAWSKYMSERDTLNLMEWMKNQQQSLQVFRYFNVYGPGEDHKGGQASPYHQFTKQAKEKGVIKVFENSENYLRDFIHVDEVVNYHLRFMDINCCGIYNIGRGVAKSFLDVAKEVASVYNAEIVEIPMPENLKHSYQEYTVADMTKTWKVLNERKIH